MQRYNKVAPPPHASGSMSAIDQICGAEGGDAFLKKIKIDRAIQERPATRKQTRNEKIRQSLTEHVDVQVIPAMSMRSAVTVRSSTGTRAADTPSCRRSRLLHSPWQTRNLPRTSVSIPWCMVIRSGELQRPTSQAAPATQRSLSSTA